MDFANPDERINLFEAAAEWLNREDAVNRDDRTTRLAWMAERINSAEHRFELGGLLGKSFFEEMRYCFAYSQFVAASLVGLAYIERTLAAYYYAAGRNDLQRATLTDLLREAQAHGLIDRDQREDLERIRQIRNAYAHFRRPRREDGVEYRAIVDDESCYGIIEQDASAVVEAALWISAQRSFS